MRLRALLACVASLALSLPVGAHAAADAGQWETDLGISFMNSTDAEFEGGTAADFESDTGFRLGIGYHFTENLEAGVSLGIGQRDYEVEIAGDEPGESFRSKGDLDYTLVRRERHVQLPVGAVQPVCHRRHRLELGRYEHCDRAAADGMLVGPVVRLYLQHLAGHSHDRWLDVSVGCRWAVRLQRHGRAQGELSDRLDRF